MFEATTASGATQINENDAELFVQSTNAFVEKDSHRSSQSCRACLLPAGTLSTSVWPIFSNDSCSRSCEANELKVSCALAGLSSVITMFRFDPLASACPAVVTDWQSYFKRGITARLPRRPVWTTKTTAANTMAVMMVNPYQARRASDAGQLGGVALRFSNTCKVIRAMFFDVPAFGILAFNSVMMV